MSKDVSFEVRNCPWNFSSGTPVFLSLYKTTFPSFNSTWEQKAKSYSVDVPLKFPLITLNFFSMIHFVIHHRVSN